MNFLTPRVRWRTDGSSLSVYSLAVLFRAERQALRQF